MGKGEQAESGQDGESGHIGLVNHAADDYRCRKVVLCKQIVYGMPKEGWSFSRGGEMGKHKLLSRRRKCLARLEKAMEGVEIGFGV